MNEDFRVCLLKIASTDLLLYKTEKERSLLEIQESKWGKILYLFKDHFGVEFETTKGVMPIKQSEATIKKMCRIIDDLPDDKINILVKIAMILGSSILALMLFAKLIKKEDAFEYSILDEIWQNEISGYDEDETKRRDLVKADFFKLSEELFR